MINLILRPVQSRLQADLELGDLYQNILLNLPPVHLTAHHLGVRHHNLLLAGVDVDVYVYIDVEPLLQDYYKLPGPLLETGELGPHLDQLVLENQVHVVDLVLE